MNSAAVIGRQIRQQNTGRTSGLPVPPGPLGRSRPRTPSHQPLYPIQLPSQVNSSGCPPTPSHAPVNKQQEQKPTGLDAVRSKVSLRCIWGACKALSGGVFLILIGTGLSVVGFYAESLSTEQVVEGNKTQETVNEYRQYHLHNLTYVGPVVMGLGGFAVVAAFVMTCEVRESAGSKVMPMHSDREGEIITDKMTDHLIMGMMGRDKANGHPSTGCPYLTVPQMSPILQGSISSTDYSYSRDEEDVMEETITVQLIPNGPSKPPPNNLQLQLPPVNNSSTQTGNPGLPSPQIDDYMPSPLDFDISDPDGCSTPRHASMSSSMDLEVYVSRCPITVRVQVEPKHFASMESDGLSDSDVSEGGTLGGQFGISLDRDLDDCEMELPLLGRCSPQFEVRTSVETPLIKKENSQRRFPLMRQTAMEMGRHEESAT